VQSLTGVFAVLLAVTTPCLVLNDPQAGRYAAGVARFDFDRELAPYDLNRYSQWTALSCHISSTVLQQLLPVSEACATNCCCTCLSETTHEHEFLLETPVN